MSAAGLNVAIADERSEIAACRHGVPGFDLGERVDVMDGCHKVEAIARLLRSMAPEALVTDEVGGEEDARALLDAGALRREAGSERACGRFGRRAAAASHRAHVARRRVCPRGGVGRSCGSHPGNPGALRRPCL